MVLEGAAFAPNGEDRSPLTASETFYFQPLGCDRPCWHAPWNTQDSCSTNHSPKRRTIMNNTAIKIGIITALCSLTLGSATWAAGGSGRGAGQGSRDGAQVRDQIRTHDQVRTQDQFRDRDRVRDQDQLRDRDRVRDPQHLQDGSGAQDGTPRQGDGHGSMERLGPADGSGTAPAPEDGTGYGTPVNQ